MRAEYHLALWLGIFVVGFIVGHGHGFSEGANTDGRDSPHRPSRDEAEAPRPLAESNVSYLDSWSRRA